MFRSSLFRISLIVKIGFSVAVGIFISYFIHEFTDNVTDELGRTTVDHAVLYRAWLQSHNLTLHRVMATTTSTPSQSLIPEAEFLKQQVRILCFVVVGRHSTLFGLNSHEESLRQAQKDAQALAGTWGKRCSELIFFGASLRTRVADITVLPLKHRQTSSWSALRESLVQISNSYLNDYDWFLRIELDSYVIVENLRYYLCIYNPSKPFYFGVIMDGWFTTSYNDYDGGIVLSRGALRQLHNSFIRGNCEESSTSGDKELGRCLSEIGVYPTDTRDHNGRSRFMASDPETYLIPSTRVWSWWESRGRRHRVKIGPECCSDNAITFHNIDYSWMHVLEFFVYHLKPYTHSRYRTYILTNRSHHYNMMML